MDHDFQGKGLTCSQRVMRELGTAGQVVEDVCNRPRSDHEKMQATTHDHRAMKFIQLATGVWTKDQGGHSHSVYGLTSDGEIYKHERGGWKLLS